MGLILAWILLACVTGVIAKSKGRSFFLWMIYGFLIFIVALPHAILLKRDRKVSDQRAAAEDMVKCPQCAEMVRAEARKCRYCGDALVPVNATVALTDAPTRLPAPNVIGRAHPLKVETMSDAPKTEAEWQGLLARKLRASCGNPEALSAIPVKTATTESTIGFLCGNWRYRVFEDTSDWNHQRDSAYRRPILMDISGGMTPDIVLRSETSGENRICLEVKNSTRLRYGMYDSQVVRYFLHLLATSRSTKKEPDTDLRRAVLLAAPDDWFENDKLVAPWNDFRNRYAGLAAAFDVTIGEIRLNDELLKRLHQNDFAAS